MFLGLGDVPGCQLACQICVTGHDGVVDSSVFSHGSVQPLGILHGHPAVAPGLPVQGKQGVSQHIAAAEPANHAVEFIINFSQMFILKRCRNR